MSHAPKPGEVDLWIFGGTDTGGTTGSGVPTFGPDSVRAHNVAPTGGTNTGSTPTTRPKVSPTTPTTSPPSSSPALAEGTSVPGTRPPARRARPTPTTA